MGCGAVSKHAACTAPAPSEVLARDATPASTAPLAEETHRENPPIGREAQDGPQGQPEILAPDATPASTALAEETHRENPPIGREAQDGPQGQPEIPAPDATPACTTPLAEETPRENPPICREAEDGLQGQPEISSRATKESEVPEWDDSVASAAEDLLRSMMDGTPLTCRDLAECSQILESRPVCKYRRCKNALATPGGSADTSGIQCSNACGREAARGFETCCKTCTTTDGTAHGKACEARHSSTGAKAEHSPHDRESKSCRFAHPSLAGGDLQLWDKKHEASLCSPGSYTAGDLSVSQQYLSWWLFRRSYESLGPDEFVDACNRHKAAFAHFNTREGARMVCRGLPNPDELQEFALKQVTDTWGAGVLHREMCQEYLDRSGQIVQNRHTDSAYSPPSRSVVKVGGGSQDMCTIARIIKIGLTNDAADLGSDSKRDTAWHGLAARGLYRWKESGPRFRADLAKRTAHGGSVYCTPAFEHAIAYSFRGAVSPEPGKPPFAAMKTKAGEKWNYSTIMQLAIYDRGAKGVVEEKHQTFGGAPDDGWDRGKIEWVVHDVSKAQIYGILFCFFPDDKNWGA